MKGFVRTFFIISLLIMVSCSGGKNDNAVYLAKVGDQQLTLSEALSDIPPALIQSDSTSAVTQFRENWIEKQLILQEAQRLNLMQNSEFRKELQRLQDEFILHKIQDYVVNSMQDEITVTEEEARNYFQKNRDRFVLEEKYIKYRHLVAQSNSDALNAREDLLRGIPWEEVAREYSLYPERKIRESERYWPSSLSGGGIPMLQRYLDVIGLNEISPVYQSDGNYHFVQLLDEKGEGEHPELDWLMSQIKEWMLLEKKKRAFNTYVKNLYLQGQANNEIEVYNVTNSNEINQVSEN